jgi:hypothetical protein
MNRPGADSAFWAQILARDSALGRYQGPEQFNVQTVNLNTPQGITLLPFSLKRPLESIQLILSGRVTVTVAPYTNVAVEAFQNLIQRIFLRGVHTKHGSQQPWDMSGASSFVYPLHYQQQGGELFVSVNGGPLTYVANPSSPFASPFTGAVGTHDFIIVYQLPLTPILGADQSAKRQETNYLFYARDWQDTLTLELTFGDASAMGDPTGATVAFTAFQSATGNPTIATHVNYGLLGPFENVAIPGFCTRNEQLLTTFTAAATQQQLTNLQRMITNAVIVKSGVLQTAGLTAGVTTFASLSDLILNRTQIQVDFNPIRRVDSNFVERAYINRMLDTQPMEGYYPLTFIESQNPLTAYRGDSPSIASATFALYSDVLTTNANQRITVVQERVTGGYYPAIS